MIMKMAKNLLNTNEAMTQFLLCFAVLVSVNIVVGTEELTVQYAPKSITFNPGNAVEISQLADVFSSVLGFTTTETSWDGIKSVSPFQRPEAIVLIEFDGFKSIDAKLDGKRFPLQANVEPSWPYQMISDRIFLHFPLQKPVLVEVNSDNLYILKYQYPDVLGDLPMSSKEVDVELGSSNSVIQGRDLTSLKISNTKDLQLLRELQILSDIGQAVATGCRKDGVPDLYWIQLSGMKSVVAEHGATSPQVDEALKIIKDTLQQVQSKFLGCYGDRLLMSVVTTGYQDTILARRTRAAGDGGNTTSIACAESKDPGKDCNVASVYEDGYPATFHIVLFTMLLYTLSVFGIGLGIWNMDPGRDSIIYRMTSTRMKRD